LAGASRTGRWAAAVAAGVVAVSFAAGPAAGGDWLQWRGPQLNGSTDEADLPVKFTKTENLAWVVRMPGVSGATPVVIGKRIFLVSTTRESDDLLAMCLSTTDGSTLWSKALGKGSSGGRGEIAACSPASDGKTVWFLFGSGDLAATDLDGKVIWQRSLVKSYGCFAIKFGYSASPLLYKGRLYIPLLRREKPYPYSPGADLPFVPPLKSYLLCLDAGTGKEIWKQIRSTDAADESREVYITPMPITAGGRTEIVIPGGEYITGHDAETGKELWRWEFTKERNIWQRIVSSPLIGEGLIFQSQARGQVLYALRPGGKGRLGHGDYAWKFTGPASDVCTPLLYRGRLYVLAEDAKVMTCLEPKTGKVVWQEKIGGAGPYRASPTGADGKIYCISEGGDFVVLAAGDKFEELYRFSLGARPCRSSIVAARGALYLRLSKHLACVRKMPPPAAP